MSSPEHKKIIGEILKNPELKAAEAIAEEFLKVFNFNEILAALDRLEKDIDEAQLASRFPRDKPLNPLGHGAPEQTGKIHVHGFYERSQNDAKKFTLKTQLQAIRTKILDLQILAKSLVLDFEASKRDF